MHLNKQLLTILLPLLSVFLLVIIYQAFAKHGSNEKLNQSIIFL